MTYSYSLSKDVYQVSHSLSNHRTNVCDLTAGDTVKHGDSWYKVHDRYRVSSGHYIALADPAGDITEFIVPFGTTFHRRQRTRYRTPASR